MIRFNRVATELATKADGAGAAACDDSVGDFLDAHRFSAAFRDWYFLPMIGCIWSCPTEQMLRFPIATLLRFCHNHGLLQIADRPQWYTVRGGARTYVARMLAAIADARLGSAGAPRPARCRWAAPTSRPTAAPNASTPSSSPATATSRSPCLPTPSDDEREVLGAIRFQPNRAVLHTDARVLPTRKARLGGLELRARAPRRRRPSRRCACTTSSTGCSRCPSRRR